MPVVSKAISSSIQGFLSLNRLTGRDAIKLVDAVSTSVATYLVTPNLVSCTLNGTAGPIGNINSMAVTGLVPTVMSGLMLSKAASKRLNGRDIKKLFDSISNGLSQILMGMVLSGTAAGIALGGGIGSFTAVNVSTLSNLMYSLMVSKQLTGRDAANLCESISFGIVNHLKSSVHFTVIVTGVIAPVPPVGPVAVIGIPSLFTKIN
jgi:hypothetical protein